MSRFGLVVPLLVFALALGAEARQPAAFQSKEGRFSVSFPDKPVEKTSKLKAGDGEVEMHVFTVRQRDGVLMTTYNDYPKAVTGDDPDKFLAGVAERNVANLKGKLVSNEKVTVGKAKHPGRVVLIEMPDKKGLYRARIVLAGARLYQVVALGPDEFAKGKVVEDYLNSFEIDG